LAAPWFLHWPGWGLLTFNLLVGAAFPVGLIAMYRALKLDEASRVLVLIGGSMPVLSFIFASAFLGETFTGRELLAIVFLVIGSVIMAWAPAKKRWLAQILAHFGHKSNHDRAAVMFALVAATFFSLYFVGSKQAYDSQNFASAFLWLRLGSALAVATFWLAPSWRQEIYKNLLNLKKKGAKLFLLNQSLSAVGFSLQSYAVSLGSVALINALQGVQYALLLILGALLTIFYPHIIKEKISRVIIMQKIAAVILIGLGLYLISFN